MCLLLWMGALKDTRDLGVGWGWWMGVVIAYACTAVVLRASSFARMASVCARWACFLTLSFWSSIMRTLDMFMYLPAHSVTHTKAQTRQGTIRS